MIAFFAAFDGQTIRIAIRTGDDLEYYYYDINTEIVTTGLDNVIPIGFYFRNMVMRCVKYFINNYRLENTNGAWTSLIII